MSQGMAPKQDPRRKFAPDASSHSLEVSDRSVVPWSGLTAGQVWSAPMPLNRQTPTKWLSKASLSLVSSKIVSVKGVENVDPSLDPFIIALNHSQKLEAIYIPALLHFLRKGKLIHFLADWNFCLVPGIWLFYHFGEVITVARKPARPRFLNVFKPLFIKGQGPFDQAIEALQSGRSIGIFPEGTTNRSPDTLLKGYSGAAQLSLNLGIPVVPAGISFPQHDKQRPIPEGIPFSVEFGKPLVPDTDGGKPSLKKVRDWHVEIMSSISRLSGKTWNRHQRKK